MADCWNGVVLDRPDWAEFYRPYLDNVLNVCYCRSMDYRSGDFR